MSLISYRNIGFVELFFFENYVISQIKEDTLLDIPTNESLIAAVNLHYNGRRFVYVSNRINAYNVSPLIYKDSSKMENLLGVCIVTKKGIAQETATFESRFYDKKFHVCEQLQDGVNWALHVIDWNERQDQNKAIS